MNEIFIAKLQTIKEMTKIFMKKKKVLMIKGNQLSCEEEYFKSIVCIPYFVCAAAPRMMPLHTCHFVAS